MSTIESKGVFVQAGEKTQEFMDAAAVKISNASTYVVETSVHAKDQLVEASISAKDAVVDGVVSASHSAEKATANGHRTVAEKLDGSS